MMMAAPSTIPTENSLPAWEAFLAAGSYTQNGWISETATPREDASMGVSPHGRVRVWFNPTLVASQKAGNGATTMAPPHTAESMVVKELYEADTLAGYAVSLKVDPTGGPSAWFYYCKGPANRCSTGSVPTTALFAKGDLNCGGCHGGFVLTQAP
jgi:hypothetical protein